MLKLVGEFGGWNVEVWAESGTASASQDEFLLADGLELPRVAVIDGVTPTPGTPSTGGIDGAAWAAGVVRALLRSSPEVIDALEEANSILFREDLPQAQRPAAAVALVELAPASVTCLRAGDCEIWELSPQAGWRPIFAGPPFSPVTDTRESGAIGHRSALLCEQTARPLPDALVLATDGARLQPERLENIERWLGELREWEDRNVGAEQKPHDDVTVVRLTRG